MSNRSVSSKNAGTWLLIKVLVKRNSPKVLLVTFRKMLSFSFFHNLKSKVKLNKIKKNSHVSYEDLRRNLTELGLRSGMKVMVHSSLSGIGYVDGGASTIINSLLDIIGPEGLLIMPAPPTTGSSIEALKRGEVFYPNSTPCSTGKICETFRQLPGVFRSYHPTHSVAAFGKDAEWLVKDHHLDPTPFGPNSPFARLLTLDAFILGIGLDTRWITFYHHFEEICNEFPIKVYSEEKLMIPVVDKNGKQILISTPYHNPSVSSFRLNNDPETLKIIDTALTKYGKIKRGKVGHGSAFLINSKNIITTLDFIFKNHYQTIYNINLIKRFNPESIIHR
jgi:aminoglycoside 3-N-acetyltransferase